MRRTVTKKRKKFGTSFHSLNKNLVLGRTLSVNSVFAFKVVYYEYA